MNEYEVRIILDTLTIYTESEERANEIAQDIMEGDAHVHLHHGFGVIDFETELINEDVDEEETEVY